MGALSLLRTVVPESLKHAGPKGLARARLLESVVGRAEQGQGLAMEWSHGERTVDSGLPRVHRETSSPSAGKLTPLISKWYRSSLITGDLGLQWLKAGFCFLARD